MEATGFKSIHMFQINAAYGQNEFIWYELVNLKSNTQFIYHC